MITNYTSKRTKKLIKEAIDLYENTKWLSNLKEQWIDKGWFYDSTGCHKDVFIKGNIVVKFDIESGLNIEFNRWLNFSKTHYRKNIARVYGIHDKAMLIQEKVNGVKFDECHCKKAKRLAEILDLLDWEFNHGHNKRIPVFFDC